MGLAMCCWGRTVVAAVPGKWRESPGLGPMDRKARGIARRNGRARLGVGGKRVPAAPSSTRAPNLRPSSRSRRSARGPQKRRPRQNPRRSHQRIRALCADLGASFPATSLGFGLLLGDLPTDLRHRIHAQVLPNVKVPRGLSVAVANGSKMGGIVKSAIASASFPTCP